MLERKAKCSRLNLPERCPAAQFLATLQKCEQVSFHQLNFAKGTNLNKLANFSCVHLFVSASVNIHCGSMLGSFSEFHPLDRVLGDDIGI